jgi:hypothetical protein
LDTLRHLEGKVVNVKVKSTSHTFSMSLLASNPDILFALCVTFLSREEGQESGEGQASEKAKQPEGAVDKTTTISSEANGSRTK